MLFWNTCFDLFFGIMFHQFRKNRKKCKVLKTLRLCIDLRVRQFKKSARCSEKMHHCFHQFFIKKSIKKQARKLEKLFSRQISITHRFLAPLLAPRVVFFRFSACAGSSLGTKRRDWTLCYAMLCARLTLFGSYFGWFSSFFSILAPFLSILSLFCIALAPFSTNFGSFFVWGGGVKSGFWGCCVVVLKASKSQSFQAPSGLRPPGV